YYRLERYAEVRAAYLAHLERMLGFVELDDPAAAASRVLDLETRLAASHWDKVSNRDPVKTYTLVDAAGLAELTPGLDWSAYVSGMQAGPILLDAVIVRQPSFLTGAAEAVAEVPISTWREWLTWQL